MMSIYPDLRKMAFGSTDRHNLVAMSWRNVFVLVIFLNLVSTRKIPPTDGDTIQISLDSTNNNTLQKVPAFSNVLLRCSLENPSWYRNNDRIGHEGKRMRSIRIDKIKRSGSGEYGCLSLKGEWANITLEVTNENSKQINIPSNIQTLSSVMEPPADSLTVPTDSDPIIRIKSFNRKDTNVRNLVLDDFQETMAAVTEDIDFNTSEDFTSSVQGRSPPVFKRQIENEIKKRSDSEVALSCPAFGSPHPNITWIKENSTLNRKLGKIRIKGWSMIIKDSTADDSGIYKCEICNTEGCISHRIHVIISVPDHTPKIINPPHNLTLITGETGEIKCKYASDVYSQVTWKFGPCHFTNSCTENDVNKQIQLNNYPMDSIQLKNVSHEDEGWYTCTVTNSLGSVSAPVYLQIVDDTPIEMDPSEPEETAPKFKNKEMPYTLPRPSGSYIKLSCLATGNPAPETNWTKDGKPINRSFGKVTYKKFAMSMEDVITEDSGIYRCDVCNTHGCIHHETKLIITDRVSHKPIIIKLPENVTVPYHGTAEMSCEVLITMFHHSIQWFYGCGPNCPDYNNSKEVKTDSENSGLLRIENVTHEDEGWYTCIAANTLGVTTASGYLHVVNELIDKTLISEPIKNHSIWIIIVTTAITLLFLLGTCFIFFIMRKLKHEKLMKHRMETVHQWTKRVVIYKPSADPGCAETLVIPIIKIEKQRTTLLQSSNTDPIPFNEYEFPLDSNWEIPRSQLILGRTLGEGAFGRVVMAEAHGLGKSSNSCIVAVKMVKEGHTDADMASLVREMEVMKMIGKHINIINLLGCCSQEGPLYVIVEYAPHGNLKDFLKKNRPSDFDVPLYDDKDFKHLTQKDLISFAFQVARGMEYLASRRCIHRDLAARNVLVSDDYVIKIADFGLARDIQDTDYYRKNTNGRLPIKWMAPESLQEKFYDTKSDVWSYGVLLWEIMTFGEQPYPQIMSAEELYNYLMSGQRMEKPQRCSLNIYMLMRQCWNFDAHARPTFSEIVENLDKILTATANANEEYLDLGVPLLETPPSSSDDESDTETLRETSPLRYRY